MSDKMRIEIRVNGEIVEVREVVLDSRDPMSQFWNFMRAFQGDISSWSFNHFFSKGAQ